MPEAPVPVEGDAPQEAPGEGRQDQRHPRGAEPGHARGQDEHEGGLHLHEGAVRPALRRPARQRVGPGAVRVERGQDDQGGQEKAGHPRQGQAQTQVQRVGVGLLAPGARPGQVPAQDPGPRGRGRLRPGLRGTVGRRPASRLRQDGFPGDAGLAADSTSLTPAAPGQGQTRHKDSEP